MTDSLDYLARRVEGDARFLAAALAPFARSEGLDDGGLAEVLGCRPGQLAAVRLCRMPADDAAGFRHDVDRIASRFGLDADALARAVRRGKGLRQLRGAVAAGGALVAARDRPRADDAQVRPPGGSG